LVIISVFDPDLNLIRQVDLETRKARRPPQKPCLKNKIFLCGSFFLELGSLALRYDEKLNIF
jgi:hypothetical protein